MFSLVGVFRGVARRQSCRLTVATRALSTSSIDVDQEYDNLTDVSQDIDTVHNTKPQDEPYPEDGIIEPPPEPELTFSKGYPILKGFQFNEFTQPKQFSRAEYSKLPAMRRRWALGPDASTSRKADLFHQACLNPLEESQNTMLMSHFVTSMGKIRGRGETKLTWKNQRRLGKAIRRAKMMGLIPILSRRSLIFSNLNIKTP